MTTLYIGSIILVILGILFSLWPYINYRLFNRIDATIEITEREAINVSLYRDHLSDLDASLKIGSIDQDQYEQLKNELERNLIEDSNVSRVNTDNIEADANVAANASSQSSIVTNKRSRVHIPIFLSFVVILPVTCIFLYQNLGNADAVILEGKLERQTQLQEQLRMSSEPEQIGVELQQLGRAIVDGLVDRSAKTEIDLDTRVLLARNAVAIGEYGRAIENFQIVLDAQPQAAQVMVELAQAIFINANNNAVPVVAMLATQALSIQPDNVMGLGLLGISNFQDGEYRAAINYWEQAIDIYPPGSQNALALKNGIEQALQRLASNGEATAQQDGLQADAADSAIVTAKLTVNVSVTDDVPIKPDQIVFIYARAWQGAKLPLAITRVMASQLPISVELDDSMAMAPQFNLSSAKTVQLVARISVTGNPIAAEGDWEVLSGPIQLKSDAISEHTLEISKPFNTLN
jgi:cytochrome c-type biogenesis protein CcmH